MNKRDNKDLKFNILVPNANLGTNLTIATDEYENIEMIKCDAIPMCNDCLFEIKEGNYICTVCKLNYCNYHLKSHNRMFIYNGAKDNPNAEIHKLYKLELNQKNN